MNQREIVKEEIKKILSQNPEAIAAKAKEIFWEHMDRSGLSRDDFPKWCDAIDALPDTEGIIYRINIITTEISLDIIKRAAASLPSPAEQTQSNLPRAAMDVALFGLAKK